MIYIGVDGGGTKTKVYLYKNETFLSEATVGPSSINKQNHNISIENIKKGIDLCYKNSKINDPIDSIFLGLTGNATTNNINRFNEQFKHKKVTSNTLITIGNDMENAFEAACSGRPSLALIVGTGSVGYGRDEQGNTHRVSGVHFFEGDLGSGYDIGKKCLLLMSKTFDGRQEKNPLGMYLLNKFEIHSQEDLSELYPSLVQDRFTVASLTKTVYEFLEKDDTFAINIFEEAASSIQEIIYALRGKLSLTNKEIGVIGGLGNAPRYFDMITNKIHEIDPSYIIHQSDHDPCYGSVLLAKKYYEKRTKT